MVTTTIKYIVYNHNGSGIRHHNFTTANDIIAEADGHASNGDTLQAQGFANQIWNGTIVPFAFMSVSGDTNGMQLYTSPGNHDVHVGDDNIIITVVYAPAGGTGGSDGCGGVWVDAFNVNTGTFSDQAQIMQVLTNGVVDAAATNQANSDGSICTDENAELMRAYDYVDGLPFTEWKQILPTQSIVNQKDDQLAKGEKNEIWITFYKSASTPSRVKYNQYEIWQWVDYATMVDGHGGPGDPGIILSPAMHEFAVGIALAKTANQFNVKFKNEILNIAAKQVELAAAGIAKVIKGSIENM